MNRKTKHIVAFFLLMFSALLSACVEKWGKPGGTEQEFEAMKGACISQSYARFPTLQRQVQLTGGYTTPVSIVCNGYGYFANCVSVGGQYVPPTFITVDDNASARDQDTRSCFFQNGWSPAN